MRCCVPFCKNTSATKQDEPGISFHDFPNEACLRAAWLRALGKQDSHLPDPAVVCSQHFLNDDIYVTENGLKKISSNAIPSILLVCTICLDTDSKLLLLSQSKLGEAYKMITGHSLCEQGNLKQTVCIQCAQRLKNFSAFRDTCLKSHTLMMELFEKHKLITKEHINKINHTKSQLKSNLVMSMLGSNPCDLYILEEHSENKESVHAESEGYELRVIEKQEESNMCMLVDDDMVANDDYYNTDDIIDPLKYKNSSFQCSLCTEEFVHEHVYMQHMRLHHQEREDNSAKDYVSKSHTAVRSRTEFKTLNSAPLSTRHASNNKHKVQDKKSKTLQNRKQIIKTENGASDRQFHPTSVINQNSILVMKNCFFCDVCRKSFKLKGILVNHMKTHSDRKPFNCKLCHFKSKYKDSLMSHMRTHTGEKPYWCKLCDYKCDRNDRLLQHMRTHTGEKPFSCKLCHYKCTTSGPLVRHMRTHTGERPYACKMCDYKCTQSSDLVKHIRTHTGDKPYSCKLCLLTFSQKCHLLLHMKAHHGHS